jgi:hypothetical protein
MFSCSVRCSMYTQNVFSGGASIFFNALARRQLPAASASRRISAWQRFVNHATRPCRDVITNDRSCIGHVSCWKREAHEHGRLPAMRPDGIQDG